MHIYIGGIATPCRVHKINRLNTFYMAEVSLLKFQLPIILREPQYLGKCPVRQIKRH